MVRLLKVDLPERPFVCTWCAERFETRVGLAKHRIENPDCDTGATVSNPLQTKYNNRGQATAAKPGEATLRRVRSKDCTHEYMREALYDPDGNINGYQCTNCYTPLPTPYVPGSD